MNIYINHESVGMQLSRYLGLHKLYWSLRRLHVPVNHEALVLEVGAGGNPYPRANVMLDALEETVERNEQTLIRDRPLVLGLVEELPFKDKAFDFVIASHVLEHTDNPEAFLNELMRVAKAGYIETPDGWFEKICAFTYHRLEVSNDNGTLLIQKKSSYKPESIAYFWDKIRSNRNFMKFLRVNPEFYHMRYYWKDSISYKIMNPETDASWEYPTELVNRGGVKTGSGFIIYFRERYLNIRRFIFSQNRRNKKININSLYRCPSCHSEELVFSSNISCKHCKAIYEVKNGTPRLFPKEIIGFNKSRIIGS
ncbi:class I SAM-dependent methyltransferase [Rhodoferax antarcticus]|uniref:class I SAM-dependent methyltransferase n=1 Tax=Rhodoferax antarcticus TaxID=81479 RepID=UPI00094F82C2|nr:class I SAM-dependent methyltransferase [Rhodoferax antarcticus]APW47773.1 hypothetical protein RA876_17055 [Rhodoferax antarcticus]